jgi:hypothetical protein
MKTNENQGFLTTPDTMGRSVPVKTPVRFKIVNEINGLVHISYGTALDWEGCWLMRMLIALATSKCDGSC